VSVPMANPSWPLDPSHLPVLQRIAAKARRALDVTTAMAQAGMPLDEHHQTLQGQHAVSQSLLGHFYGQSDGD
jgi:hypothetical protein